ncbi:MAG: hypothetical protein ACYDEN_07605 [Acidimicrobiales bacterium]
MGGQLEPSWDLDVAAAMLRTDTADVDSLLDVLGAKLERILGSRAQVQRDSGFRRSKRVAKIVVDAGGNRLEATRNRTGPSFCDVHAVRGITLRTTEITADEWLDRLVELVKAEAGRSNDVRTALGRLLE